MKKSLVRVGVVGLVGLGAWLATLFWKGPGLGETGSGLTQDHSIHVDATPPEGELIGDWDPLEEAPPPEMLTVTVAEDGYVIRRNETGRERMATLADIRTLAAETTGSPEGIKIRILKSRHATAGDLTGLKSALAEVGVKQEEIQERADFID